LNQPLKQANKQCAKPRETALEADLETDQEEALIVAVYVACGDRVLLGEGGGGGVFDEAGTASRQEL
jgi:hypothetical protein